MASTRRTKTFIATIVVIVVVIGSIGAVLLTRKPSVSTSTKPSDASKQVTPTKDTPTETDVTATDTSAKPAAASVDPATLSSVAIEPLSVTVFYSKGTPGFEYTILKTADQTQYVQFTSTDLIGSKCTDDKGEFASIIKNPSSIEAQTTSQTTKVGNDTYGLSLASASCTGNTDLLDTYQTGFKNGFSSLASL